MKSIILFYLVFGFSLIFSQENLEIEGAIIMGNSLSKNPTPTPGTIRWTGLNFEGWNGFIWVPLTSFSVNQIISDTSGNQYRTVIIGDQEWMAENLRTDKYRNGDLILNITNDTDWSNLGSGAYCWYDNNSSFDKPFGKLYNWYAVNDSRILCPSGWHVPSDNEWTDLTDFLGSAGVAAGPLKEASNEYWNSPNIAASNSTGFSALPGGYRNSNGFFSFYRLYFYSWSSSEHSNSEAWERNIWYQSDNVFRNPFNKKFGFSVRCVKD